MASLRRVQSSICAERIRRCALTLIALLATNCLLIAQSAKRLELKVYSVSGEYVYFKAGRNAGLRPGDILLLTPKGAAQIRAIVKEVSKSRTRALLEKTTAVIPLGTKASVEIPKSRFMVQTKETPSSGKAKSPQRPVPDHPPWEQGLDGREQDLPLLAPISSRTPKERAMQIHGRAWWNTDYNQSKVGGTNKFYLADIGTDTSFENLFGSGGELRVRGDLFTRRADLELGRDSDESTFRLDRLSYELGFADDADMRWQAGRFLPEYLPEFGVLDGGSIDHRLGTGNSRLAFAVGSRPDPQTIQAQTDDYQASLYYDFNPTDDQSFELGAGYLKSWHEGDSDRDLFVFKGFYRPSNELSFHSSLLLDYYSGSEQVKEKGFEITQFQTNANWSLNFNHGASLYIDYFRMPEIGRPAFLPVGVATLLREYTFRTTLRTWHRVNKTVRMDFTVAPWTDNDQDGINAEVGVSLSDLLYERGAVKLDVFQREGTYNEGYGARLALSGYTLATNWRFSYELSRFSNKQQLIADDTSLHHAITGSLDWNVYATTDLLFNADYRTGDNINSQSVGIYLQTRF